MQEDEEDKHCFFLKDDQGDTRERFLYRQLHKRDISIERNLFQ